MIELFKDTDLEQRKLIYIIYENNFKEIVQNQNTEDAIQSMWNGNVEAKTSLYNMFYVTQNLFYKDINDSLFI